MYSIYEVPYYQVIMLPLLVNFLPHLIHSSLTYEILKLVLPLLNLALTETWPQEPSVPFSFSCNYLYYLVIINIITSHHKDFIKKIKFYFPPIQPLNGRPLLFLWALIFLWYF